MNRFLQNLFSGFMAFVSALSLFFIMTFPRRWVFFPVLAIWFVFLIIAERKILRGRKDIQSILPILLVTAASFVSLSSIVEWGFIKWPFVVLLGLIIFLLFQSIVTDGEGLLHIQQKPYRRIMVLIWSFDAYALLTALFALSLFFPNTSFLFVTLAGGVIFGAISFMVWRMYFQLQAKQSLVWVFLVSFLMIEIVWSMHFLPFGYLASGFFVTWFWYILQLLIRFHFSTKGVLWKKQAWFLISNLILWVILMVFFVRWV